MSRSPLWNAEEYAQTPLEISKKIKEQFDLTLDENLFSEFFTCLLYESTILSQLHAKRHLYLYAQT
jgi:hypothetical protein